MMNESWCLSDGCGSGRVSCQSSLTSQTSESLFTVTDSQAAQGFSPQTRQPLGTGLGIACVYVCCRDGLGAVAPLAVADLQQLCSDNARRCGCCHAPPPTSLFWSCELQECHTCTRTRSHTKITLTELHWALFIG